MTARTQRRTRRLAFQQNAQPRVRRMRYHEDKMPEMLRQNLDQVEMLVSRRTPLESVEEGKTFRLQEPEFKLGQWVDVKDTVGQWLEAQVTKIQGSKVFVHFNGWGTRWDEWIEKDSPRISQFRTYTVQSPLNPFLSPYPCIEADAEDHEIPSRPVPCTDLIARYIKCFDRVRKMLVQYLQLKVKFTMQANMVGYYNQLISQEERKTEIEEFREEEEKLRRLKAQMKLLSGQLSPIMDRMGRMMGDMAPYFAFLTHKARGYDITNSTEFTRFPEAEGTDMEQQVPVMPNPGDVALLYEFTEQRERNNSNAIQAIFIIAGSRGNSELGVQIEQSTGT
eukprot:TRINITY_DN1171_c0_g5_i2.p1 TRINITY_DN1171_c0_g5~~TRINITY_DN1171_c0_g5_i2.p1  ORF type:complete len:336 (-),score=65.18 TRINITY_DN1171_c0_g5_i2:161-1168(-)